jgi:hypothetical protein
VKANEVTGIADLVMRQRRQQRLDAGDVGRAFRLEALQSADRWLLYRDRRFIDRRLRISFGLLLSVMLSSLGLLPFPD